MSPAVLAGILVAALIGPAQGSEGAPVATGDRIRVHTSSDKAVGAVTSVSDDQLVIETLGAGPRIFARADLRRLEISRGRSSRKGAITGFLVGGAIGAGLGLWYKAALEKTESSSMFALLPMIGASVCGATGAGIGALAKQEEWRDVPPARVSVHTGASESGIRLSLSVRF